MVLLLASLGRRWALLGTTSAGLRSRFFWGAPILTQLSQIVQPNSVITSLIVIIIPGAWTQGDMVIISTLFSGGFTFLLILLRFFISFTWFW